MEIYSLEIEAQLDVTRSLSKPLNEASNRYDSIGYREHTAEEEKQAEKEYERCKAEYDKEISRLNTLLEKAFKWFPLLKEMLRMKKLCAAIGFTKEMIESLLTKKEAIRCNGRIYSEEHRRKFDIRNDIFKIEKNPTDDSKLVLTINKQPIGEWFKEQWEKLRQGLRQPAVEPRKSRGMKL